MNKLSFRDVARRGIHTGPGVGWRGWAGKGCGGMGIVGEEGSGLGGKEGGQERWRVRELGGKEGG